MDFSGADSNANCAVFAQSAGYDKHNQLVRITMQFLTINFFDIQESKE